MKQNPKKSRFFKIFGGLSLATLITCGTVLAFTPIFSNSTANTNSQNLSAQDQLLNGTLELDPDNDPLIFSNNNGLDIRYCKTTINNSYYDKDTAGQATSPTGLSGYAYLRLGKYYWVIIGYNSTSTTTSMTWSGEFSVSFSTYLENPSSYSSFAGFLETSTPAGLMIDSESNNDLLWNFMAVNIALDYSLAVKNTTELNSGEFLVICQGTTGSTTFGGNGVYSSSSLLSAMRNLYYPPNGYNNAEFTPSEKNLIITKTLTTSGSSSLTEYLFPLGHGSNETFSITNYLPDASMRNCGSTYWLRSYDPSKSTYVYVVVSGGTIYGYSHTIYYHTRNIRPAMVIKL